MEKTMNKIFAMLLHLVLLSAFLFGCRPQENLSAKSGVDTQWLSYTEGAERAKKENKLIIVDFYADWCTWCRVMDIRTLRAPEIAQKLKADFVTVRINVDASEPLIFRGKSFSSRNFAAGLGIESLPTLAFFESDESVITKIPGFMEKQDLLPVLNYLSEGCHTKNISYIRYKADPQICSSKSRF